MSNQKSDEINCLIFDSEKKNWPQNNNLYFMGYWCLEQIDGAFSEKHKFNIVNSADNNIEITNKNMNEIYSIYHTLILELTNFLNNHHKKNFSKRYWEIIIGPWLKIFLGIVNERYTSMKNAFEKYKINKILLSDYTQQDFFVSNVTDLEKKASTNQNFWNNILYTKIYEFLSVRCEELRYKIENNSKKNPIQKKTLKKKIINALSIFNIFCSNIKHFIYLPGLKLKDEIKLKLQLNQFPFIFSEIDYPSEKIDIKLRQGLKILSKKNSNSSEFENLVRLLIFDLFPTDFLENYERLQKIVKKLHWPKNPKIIFTSLAYHGNEIFKIYTAAQVEKGTKYFLGQHGANYFTGKNTLIEPGFDCSDKFFSWGDIKKDKCVNFFNVKYVNSSKENNVDSKKVFFFMPKMSRIRKRPWDDYGQMIRENASIENILFNLDLKIQNLSVLKLYPNEYNSEELEKKILKEITFKRKKYRINRNLKNNEIFHSSKLIVNSGEGTAFLETITSNIPTVAFVSNFNLITKSALLDYSKLEEAKIIFRDEYKMAQHINSIFDNIDNWWENGNVKKIKNDFCQKYAKVPPENHLSILANKISLRN